MWIFDKLIELADDVLETLRPEEEKPKTWFDELGDKISHVKDLQEKPSPQGFLFVSDENGDAEEIGQVSNIVFTYGPPKDADIVDDDITDAEMTSGEYSRKILEDVKNPYKGFRLVSKDGLWYIFKRPSGMFWGEPQYEVYHRTKGAFMNRQYLVEVGEFHGCAYKSRESALNDINAIVEKGLDNFFFDDVVDF